MPPKIFPIVDGVSYPRKKVKTPCQDHLFTALVVSCLATLSASFTTIPYHTTIRKRSKANLCLYQWQPPGPISLIQATEPQRGNPETKHPAVSDDSAETLSTHNPETRNLPSIIESSRVLSLAYHFLTYLFSSDFSAFEFHYVNIN